MHQNGELTLQSYKTLKSRLIFRVKPYFDHFELDQIDANALTHFHNHLREKSSAQTTKYILQQFQSLLKYGCENGILKFVPLFPKIKTKTTSRGSFSLREYSKLLRTAKKLSKIVDPPPKITHRNSANSIYAKTNSVPEEMAWLIGFMVNSFVRPSDIKLIQHKHVQIIRGKHTYLRLTLPETKLHTAQIVTLRPAVRIYESLKKHMAKKGFDKPNDYLFLPEIKERFSAMRLISGHFNKCMNYAEIKKNELGQNRTLYSLRHTSIMFRLLYGSNIDLLSLARNARTSVEMIENFYARNLSAEMNIDLIQSKR